MINPLRRLFRRAPAPGTLVGVDGYNRPVLLDAGTRGLQVIGSASTGRVTRSAGPILAQWVSGPDSPPAIVIDTRGSHTLALALAGSRTGRQVRVLSYRPGLPDSVERIGAAGDCPERLGLHRSPSGRLAAAVGVL